MRTLCAIGLTLAAIGSQSTLAAGPLERSLLREATRLAALPAADAPDWRPLRALGPGAMLVVTTATDSLDGALVEADASSLTLLVGEVARRVAMQDVVMVVRRGSARAAVAGTLIGMAAAPWLAYALVGDGSGRASALGYFTTALGLPIGFGYGSWRRSSHVAEEIIYRRSAAPRSGVSPAEPS